MWFSFFIYSVLTALLPGPNNILAINSTMKFGYQKSKSLLLGIYTGFTLIMLLTAVFTELLLSSYAPLLNYLKYLGAAYLVYLAWTVFTSKPVELKASNSVQAEPAKQGEFWKGFLLQLVNVKIIIYGITAFSSFVFTKFHEWWITLIFVVFLSFVGSFASWLWALAGQRLSLFLNNHHRIVSRVMGLLLLYCAVSLFI